MSADPATAGAGEATTAPATSGNSAVQALAASLRLPGTGGNLASLTTAINGLKTDQQRLKDEKKRLAKELKNQQRRKRRLKGKARQLSNEDLLAVLLMREESMAAANPDADLATDAPMAAASGSENRPASSSDAA